MTNIEFKKALDKLCKKDYMSAFIYCVIWVMSIILTIITIFAYFKTNNTHYIMATLMSITICLKMDIEMKFLGTKMAIMNLLIESGKYEPKL